MPYLRIDRDELAAPVATARPWLTVRGLRPRGGPDRARWPWLTACDIDFDECQQRAVTRGHFDESAVPACAATATCQSRAAPYMALTCPHYHRDRRTLHQSHRVHQGRPVRHVR
jgi:hypothetical protein